MTDNSLNKTVFAVILVISILIISGCETIQTIAGEDSSLKSNFSAAIENNISVSIENKETKQKFPPTVIIVKETEIVSLEPKAEDPDDDSLVFSYTSPLDDKGQWQTTYGDAGEYTMTVTVSDGKLADSRDVLVIVNKKEELPVMVESKPIESAVFVEETSALKFSLAVEDLNNDPITYSWKLDGNVVSTEDNYVFETTYDDAGSHTVKVDVSDGTSEVNRIWSVTVDNVNRKPELEDIGEISIKETEKVLLKLTAADPDDNKLEYSVSDSRFKKISDNEFEWQTDYDSAGEYSIEISVTDGQDTVSKETIIKVANMNRPPVIKEILHKS